MVWNKGQPLFAVGTGLSSLIGRYVTINFFIPKSNYSYFDKPDSLETLYWDQLLTGIKSRKIL